MSETSAGDISAEQVAHLANLARIDLSPEELESLTKELGQIVESVAKVQEVAGPDVPATSHPLPLTNVFRDDVVVTSLDRDEVLAAAPAAEDGRFRVPPILGLDS